MQNDFKPIPSSRRKFTDEQVTYIRTTNKTGWLLQKELGVNRSTITRIRQGKTYKEQFMQVS